MNKEEMIEEIKKMTVVELADLVKAIEEEFGVSAVAAAAPAAGGAAGAAVFLRRPSSPQGLHLFSSECGQCAGLPVQYVRRQSLYALRAGKTGLPRQSAACLFADSAVRQELG